MQVFSAGVGLYAPDVADREHQATDPTSASAPTIEEAGEPAPSTTSIGPMLQELLEQASRVHATRFGAGTLVGECVDTHHPHLPRRVLVSVTDDQGKPAAAWLPTLADLRIRAGQKVLVSKPDNWPEPVVVGVLAGLERSAPIPAEVELEAIEPESAQLRLGSGEALVVTGPDGRPLLQITHSPEGPQLRLLQANVAVDTPGTLRLGADRIELHAREGGVDIRTDGDAIVRARIIRLN